MTLQNPPGIEAQLAEMRTMLVQIHEMLAQPRETRECYTVDEVAAMLGRTAYSVREWCRLGRINAMKRSERRGGAELWSISASEVTRYKDEGLLPLVPRRNAGS